MSEPEPSAPVRKAIEAIKDALRQEHQQQLAEVEEIERLENLAAKYGLKLIPASSSAPEAPRPAAPLRKVNPPAPSKSGRGGSRPKPDSISARACKESEKIIRQLGRPIPLSELYEKVAARGIKFGGKHPSWQLSGLLGKVDTLISSPRGWWLKGEPMPPAKASEFPWEQ